MRFFFQKSVLQFKLRLLNFDTFKFDLKTTKLVAIIIIQARLKEESF